MLPDTFCSVQTLLDEGMGQLTDGHSLESSGICG